MILIAAENQELALSISINQRNPHRTPKNPARGYYLALTFGTLLSSQRADARKLHPHGLRSRRLLVVHRTTVGSRRNFPLAPDGVSRGAERKLRPLAGRVKPLSGDAGHAAVTRRTHAWRSWSGHRRRPLDPGDRALATAQHQPAARQPGVLPRHRIGVGDPLVVEVRPALLHRAPGLGQAAGQPGELEQLGHRRHLAVHGDAAGLPQGGSQRPLPERGQLVPAEERPPGPKSARPAASACRSSSGPWTSRVNSSARARCAVRAAGRSMLSAMSASRSSAGRSENSGSQARASASSALSQNWKKAYGDVSAGSSQTFPPSDLPNFVPSDLVTRGVHSACTVAPSVRRTRSMPAVRLPHWSDPPVCRLTPCRR